MADDIPALIAEARSIGNWDQHATGPEGNGAEGPTLFARLVFALEVQAKRISELEAVTDAQVAIVWRELHAKRRWGDYSEEAVRAALEAARSTS